MKKMRKALALLLVAAMAMSLLCVGVFAEGDNTTPTYSITAPDNGHTYEAYQIFTGDLAGTVLSNVKWGQNGTGTKDEAVAKATLDEITAAADSDTAKLEVIEKYVNLNGTAYATIESGKSATVPAGYYLIKDVDDTQKGTADAYTLYVVQIVGDVTISPKSGTPSVIKKVKDTNDSTGDTTDWQDSADYDIGDDVPFQLTASIPEQYATYKDYYLSFNDTLSAGLTLNASSIVVKVDGTNVANDKYYIYGGQNSFKVVIYDLKTIKSSGAKTVTVEYTAKLNDAAKIGSEGNPNVVDLTFSNNPNVAGKGAPKGDTPGTPEKPENPDTPDTPSNPGTPETPDDTGKTPEDKVIVFTYKVTVDKVKETINGEALKGAGFTLYKWNAASTAEDKYEAVGEEVKGTDMTTFVWKGVDDGQYKLVETTTPAGYNTITPVEFTIEAEHQTEAADPKLTSLSGNVSTGEVTFTRDANDEDSLDTKIVNKSGSTLPTTGGVGTTLFYVFGAILVLGAGVLLVTKKRMAHE